MEHRWCRGSINKNQISEIQNGVELIRNVGTRDEPLTDLVTISPNDERTGFGIKKVVMPNMGTDSDKIGAIKPANINHVGGHSVVFLTLNDNEVENYIIDYLETKTIKTLIKSIKTNTPNSKSLFKYIPDLDFSKTWTDEELYNYFNLTQEEINYIEETVK